MPQTESTWLALSARWLIDFAGNRNSSVEEEIWKSKRRSCSWRFELVFEGHTRELLAETDLMTLRIHCYAPGIGENALHSHTKEDQMLPALQGMARSSPPDATARGVTGGKKSSGRAPGLSSRSVLQLGQ